MDHKFDLTLNQLNAWKRASSQTRSKKANTLSPMVWALL